MYQYYMTLNNTTRQNQTETDDGNCDGDDDDGNCDGDDGAYECTTVCVDACVCVCVFHPFSSSKRTNGTRRAHDHRQNNTTDLSILTSTQTQKQQQPALTSSDQIID